MKKFILPIILLILIVALVGCNQAKENSISNYEADNLRLKNEISQKDIEEGKKLVERYFKALQNKDIVGANETLGRYKSDLYDESNIGKWIPKLISINYPGKYTNENIPPKSYKANFGETPYKSMTLYVEYELEGEKQGWDYILVKETEGSPWLIHDWGY